VNVRDALASWQPVYLTAGAAAATLVGLLFVGLSLHIRVVAAQPDVRSLARVTLTEFFVVLLVALAVLQPTDSGAQVGDWLVGISIVSVVLIIRPVIDGVRSEGGRIGLRMLIARFGVSTRSFLGFATAGALFIRGNATAALDLLLPVLVLALVVAVRNTWDLLVTVAERSDSG
jgi:glycerol uptake facilitator-like aquaporin